MGHYQVKRPPIPHPPPPLTLGLTLVRQVHQNRNVHPLRKSGLKSLARASLVCADLSHIPEIATTEAGDLVR